MAARTLSIISLVLLAGCGSSESVTAENASVAEVARKVDASGIKNDFVSPGHWQMAMQMKSMNVPGMPPEMADRMKAAMGKARTFETCVTPEEAKRPSTSFFAGEEGKACRYDKFQFGNGKIDMTMRCNEDGAERTMTMTGTYSGDEYRMTIISSGEPGKGNPMSGATMEMEIAGKRTAAACTGKEDG